MNTVSIVLLMIFSGLGMNLMLQCALGIRGASKIKNPCIKTVLVSMGIVFLSIILLWIVFTKIITSIISGLYIYVLLFPVSSLVYDGIEFIVFRYLYKKDTKNNCLFNFYGGITAAALFITLNIANSILDAFSLSFGFSFGVILSFLILGEIQKRAALEAVPVFLRGNSLILISVGLLSLVFSAASILMYRVFGG